MWELPFDNTAFRASELHLEMYNVFKNNFAFLLIAAYIIYISTRVISVLYPRVKRPCYRDLPSPQNKSNTRKY